MKSPEKFVADNFDSFLDCIDDIVTVMGKNAVVEKVNKAFAMMTGVDPSPYIGKSMKDLIALGFFKESAAIKAIETKKAITMNVEYYNGITINWTYVPFLNDKGEVERLIGIGRDITKLIKLELQLHQSRAVNDQFDQKIKELSGYVGAGFIVHASDEMERVIKTAIKAAKTDSSILILGETGVGKELIAELIHQSSERKEKPFIVVNSAAIPEALMESELFGYETGAFTGAQKGGHQGLLEKAKGGTLFLDEIGELPLSMQSKLLRVTEEGKFSRIGGHNLQETDFRIIAATNIPREQMLNGEKFRQDLFYRLGAVIVQVPALRERRSDIFPLIRHFVKLFNLKYNKDVHIPSRLMTRLFDYGWPGNIRELKNLVNSLIVLTDGDEVQDDEFYSVMLLYRKEQLRHGAENREQIIPKEVVAIPHKKQTLQLEEDIFRQVYREHGSMMKAAAALGIHPTTLYRKIKKGLIRRE